MPDFVTRFAPSPTGYLHLGHAYSALTAYRAAQEAGGRFLLRIEDIDQGRCRPEFESAIYEDLAWLGMDWETPVRRQSEHFDDYERALSTLRNKGVVYRCFKTRKEVAEEIARAPHLRPEGPDGVPYIGAPLATIEERNLLADGKAFAWRLSVEAAKETLGARYETLSFSAETANGGEPQTHRATPEIFGDVIIARKDFGTSYHLSSVFDDALQGVTHVIRGEDLAAAAHLHVLLQALLDLPTPAYRHHSLIMNEKGDRLAKRDQAATLKTLRENGTSPSEIVAMLEPIGG